ncbi:MAG: ComEC/Rec2 family competence protein [Prevotellaceae bacterium]|nr:ComEC/Rec2 family competence protein [Prevotellaceae bacterium]
MRRYLLLLLAAALALGIALSPLCPLPPLVLFLSLTAVVACLVAAHLKGWSRAFLCLAFLAFVIVGLWRAGQGDWHLLPQCLEGFALRLRELARGRLYSLPLSDEAKSLLDAMMFAQRASLSADVRHLYSEAGAGHLLALSGLHLGILFGLLYLCLLQGVEYVLLRRSLAIVGIVAMWAYALLVGFPVSLVRASVMMTLLFVSQLRLSGSFSWHTLALAALLILFVSPSSLGSVSLQLSFTSVAGLLLFYEPLYGTLRSFNYTLNWLWGAFVVSVSAQIGSLPLVAYYFHQYSLYSVLLSPVYIFLATFILYLALLSLLFATPFLCSCVSALVSSQHGLMRLVASLPFSVWRDIRLSPAQVALLYMTILCLAPTVYGVRKKGDETAALQLAYYLRLWPYTVAAILCLLAVYLLA